MAYITYARASINEKVLKTFFHQLIKKNYRVNKNVVNDPRSNEMIIKCEVEYS